MIAILCPTRGRPEQFHRMMKSAKATASDGRNVDLLMYVADDDADKGKYHYLMHWYGTMCSGADYPTAHKWNLLAYDAMQNPNNKLFMLGSDDMYFETEGWDKALIDYYNALENKIHVYALRDSRDENGTPHIIATREYIESMGYFVPPIFLHWFIDSWTVEIAKANGVFTHLKDFTLVHDKPSDRGEADETHSRIRSWGWHERDKYVNEKSQHFLAFEKQRLAIALLPEFTGQSDCVSKISVARA